MLVIKKLRQPSKKSGKKLMPKEVSSWKKYGVKVVNIGNDVLYVDSVTYKILSQKKKK